MQGRRGSMVNVELKPSKEDGGKSRRTATLWSTAPVWRFSGLPDRFRAVSVLVRASLHFARLVHLGHREGEGK